MTTTIIILAIALIVWMVLYFRLKADYKDLDKCFDANAEKWNTTANHNSRLTAQLDQLSFDYNELHRCYDKQLAQAKKDDEEIIALRRANENLLIEYNRYHRKRGVDGRFVKKGGKV